MTFDRICLRIINKIKFLFDRGIWPLYTLLKYFGVVRPVNNTISKVISPGIKVINPPPSNYSSEDEKKLSHWVSYSTNDLKIFLFKNVSVSAEGIVFKGLSISEAILIHPIFKFTFGLRYLVWVYLNCKKEVIKDDSPCILIFDHWSCINYYHWVIDSLPRLYSMGADIEGCKLILPGDVPLYIRQSLDAFNFKEIIEVKKKRYLGIPNLLVPNYTAGSGWQNKMVLQELKGTLLGVHKSIGASNERIYASRRNQKNRRIHNEEEVIKLITEFGFSIIYFEDMTFWEQVNLMRNAKYFISSHGANVTNIYFLPENAKVLELNREINPNFCYYSLASSVNLSYFYQLCQNVGHDDILVDINLLRRNVDLILSEGK